MMFLNAQSRLASRSVLNVSLWALFSVGLLSGCSEEAQQKATDALEEAKGAAAESVKKAQETVDQAVDKVGEVTKSATDSVTETVEETYEKAKSLSSIETMPVLLAENTLSGEALYNSCVACHGAKGEGGVGPKLAGKEAEQMLANLKTYRAGGQVGPMSSMMTPSVKNLSDADLESLINHISQF